MVHCGNLLNRFTEMVAKLAKVYGKMVDLKISGNQVLVDKAIAEKIDRLWEKAKSEQAAGDYLEALVTVGEALGLSPDSAQLLAFRDELVAQHESELQTQRDENQVGGLTDLARKELTMASICARSAASWGGRRQTLANTFST